MSTHNIGFNEELTKIIFQIIIKYALYLFSCQREETSFGVSVQVGHESGCKARGLKFLI